MVFSSLVFLFFFLPLVLLGNCLLRRHRRPQNVLLFLLSLFFYAWGEPKFVAVMALSIAGNYLAGLRLESAGGGRLRRAVFAGAIVFNVGILFTFKYLDFFVANVNQVLGTRIEQPGIPLPIGISFFTFQAMSYVIDVYRRITATQRDPIALGLYIAFFPQLVAGPIVRYETIARQIDGRRESFALFCSGVDRFIIGMGKKVLLANTLAIVADAAFDYRDGPLSMAMAAMGVLAYTMQIYFDFSGYSDMAIGLGRMFGFKFLENFNYPYVSRTVSEFWRRWHISLGTWFRDYVYFPLGGSRVGAVRLLFNLFLVWFLTGLWHGANWTFIVWGMLYFAFIALEKTTGLPAMVARSAAAATLYRGVTLLCVILGWAIFRSTDIGSAIEFLKSLAGLAGNPLVDDRAVLYANEFGVVMVMAALFCFPWVAALKRRLFGKIRRRLLADWLHAGAMVTVYALSVAYLVKGIYNPFIYFNF